MSETFDPGTRSGELESGEKDFAAHRVLDDYGAGLVEVWLKPIEVDARTVARLIKEESAKVIFRDSFLWFLPGRLPPKS